MGKVKYIQKEVGSKSVLIQPFSALPCELEIFTINGINANQRDFGKTYDAEKDNAENYCCGCMMFERCKDRVDKKTTMEKYSLSWEEYDEICELLEEVLYVGYCSWCS